jgi:murein DD-endopeptidase MepM/ murein hydrolase activator NlpD
MKTKLFPMLFAGVLIFLGGCAKDKLPEGLDWTVIEDPSPLPLMSGNVALVYEIKIKNSSIDGYKVEFSSIKNGSTTLQNLSGADLDSIISVYHSDTKLILAGETAILFMWVELQEGQATPGSLTQTIQFYRLSDAMQYTREIQVNVRNSEPVKLAFPLKARRYATPGAPANDSYHRRTINYIDGQFYGSERYAIDFIGLDDGNRYRQGRQDANIDYYGYQDIIYSATAGTVVSIVDTISENVPPNVPEVDPANLYRAFGNQVVVKASEGVYVLYGHLVDSGSDLKVGDHVEVGQPLGRVGNSGNCDSPQLHLQVMTGSDPLKSEGLPWVFDTFVLHGYVTGYDQVNGLVDIDYLNIYQTIAGKNLGREAVVGVD